MSNKGKRFRDFGSGGEVSVTPVSFSLHGEEFECRTKVQGKVLLQLVAQAEENDGAGVVTSLTGFFDVALLPESLERFNALLEDPDRVVTVETLGEIVGWLVEQYSARPTERPESSSTGD
jgi:hypothetical protein